MTRVLILAPFLLLILLLISPRASRAEYIGREPERLARLGGAPSGLAQQYAQVLRTLRSSRELSFDELRSALAGILAADPFFADVFDVWLGLNPTKPELTEYLAGLRSRAGSAAAWQRGEVLLRLGQAREAAQALEAAGEDDLAFRNRRDRALARADFQLGADAAGQTLYDRLLDRLDEATSELLFRDIAAVASAAERDEYARLPLAERAGFFRRFWTTRNPVPILDQNPRLAEHYRRLARALADYGLQSNGHGYFTDRAVFASLTPKLSYFDPAVVFEEGATARYWLDPRGLLLLRHGEPDQRFGAHPVEGAEPSESWLVSRYRSRPLVYHFVKRAPAGEWTLALNLGVAAVRRGAVADDPDQIAPEVSRSLLRLYESRLRLHPVYQEVLEARSQTDVSRALHHESEVMAGFLKAALASDSTAYYTEKNTLPLDVSVSNLYAHGKPAIEVEFATDLSVIDKHELAGAPSLDVVLTLYDRQWITIRRRVERTVPIERPPGGKFKGYLGRLRVDDLEPEDYRMALVVFHRGSGRIGLARGEHEVIYVPEGDIGMSDLMLARRPRATGAPGGTGDAARWVPAPEHAVDRKNPFRVDLELYNLRPDKTGRVRYEVEERVLTLYEKPGLLSKIAGYGGLAGQMMFPLYSFLGQSGRGVLAQATASETDGLTIAKRTVEREPAPVIGETVQTDLSKLKPGVYTVYVTVRDLRTREVVSRALTWQVN